MSANGRVRPHRLRWVSALVALLVAVPPAQAPALSADGGTADPARDAAPGVVPNDDFENAQTISDNATVHGDSTGATMQPGEHDEGGTLEASVWFTMDFVDFGVAVEHWFTVRSDEFDPVLSIFEGDSLDSLTLLWTNDDWFPDSGLTHARVRRYPDGDRTLRIQVTARAEGELGLPGGAFTISASDHEPFSSDSFGGPMRLTSSGTWELDTWDLTTEPGEPLPEGGASTHWFQVDGSFDGTVRLDLTPRDEPRTLAVSVYRGSTLQDLTLVDRVVSSAPSVTIAAVAGVDHRIQVAEVPTYGAMPQGRFRAVVDVEPTSSGVPFDTPETALSLSGAALVSNVGATVTPGEQVIAGTGASVWFVLPASGSYEDLDITTRGSGVDTALQVFTRRDGSMVLEAGNDDEEPGSDHSRVEAPRQAGIPWYVQVTSRGAEGDIRLHVRRHETLSFTVTGRDGRPVDGACAEAVVSRPGGGEDRIAPTSPWDDVFHFSPIPVDYWTGEVSVEAWDCTPRSGETVAGTVRTRRFPSQATTYTGDSDDWRAISPGVSVMPLATLHGRVVGHPGGEDAPCAEVYHLDPVEDRVRSSARVDPERGTYVLHETDISTPWMRGEGPDEVGTLVIAACTARDGEDQQALLEAWPYPPVFLGGSPLHAEAVDLPNDLDAGAVSRHDLPYPPAMPELISYHPGPDGDGQGRLWVTDVLTGHQRLATRFGTNDGWQTHVAGDLDGDGRTDLYSYYPGPDGDGHGRWWTTDLATGRQQRLTDYGTATGWQTHLVADLDGDGRDELLSYAPANGSWWATSVRDGTAVQRRVTTFGTRTGWQTHRTADVDGDGRDEILSYHPGTGRWWVTSVDADGVAHQRRVATYGTRTGWDEHLVGDVDGDGVAELLSFHAATGRWWSTDISRSPARSRILATYGDGDGLEGTRWSQHLAVDSDLDGRVELFSFEAHTGYWIRTPTTEQGLERPWEIITRFGTVDGWQLHLAADVR